MFEYVYALLHVVPEEVDSTLINTEIRFDTSATPHLEINFQV